MVVKIVVVLEMKMMVGMTSDECSGTVGRHVLVIINVLVLSVAGIG